MSYKEKPQLKLYTYINEQFELQAIIDDYESVSIENNLYQAGQFLITINYNIPNALLFQRKMFIQFGNDPYNFGEIYNVSDAVSSDGKGGQKRTISGYDARYLFKRRIIKNLNSNDTWNMTAKGEICLRSLIYSEAGEGAETKRRLPINNIIPASENALGKEYTVSEAFTNLYDVLCTIATQSEIGWRVKFDGELTLEVFNGEDISDSVFFSTDFESLENGNFNDTSESFTNAVYVGGKGDGSERDIYEGESAIEGSSPSSLDRFESWDNQSELTNESEYENEALSILSQYGQNLVVNGNGLAKCPYIFKEQYNIGDTIKISFSGKSANVQILSVTEFWQKGNYQTTFSFGKPQNNLKDQLQLILKKIQIASNKAKAIDSVMWYTVPNTLVMNKSEVTFNTIGFTGDIGTGETFKLYIDDENTGSKNYNVYIKNLAGSGKLTLATDREGSSGLELPTGSYVAQVYVDTDGNVLQKAISTVNTVESGNLHSVTSNAVAEAMAYDFSYYTQGKQTVFIIKIPYINESHSTNAGCIIINARYGYRYILDYYNFVNESNFSNNANVIAKFRMLDGAYSAGNYLETKLKWDVDTTNKKIIFYLKKTSLNTRLTFKVLDNYLTINDVEFSTTTDTSVWNNAQYSSDVEYLSPRGLNTFYVGYGTPVNISLSSWGTYICLGNIDGSGNFAFLMTIASNQFKISNINTQSLANFYTPTLSNNVIRIGNTTNSYITISISSGILTFTKQITSGAHITIIGAGANIQ